MFKGVAGNAWTQGEKSFEKKIGKPHGARGDNEGTDAGQLGFWALL